MNIPGTIVVTEPQADVFELEKIRTKIADLDRKKYPHLCNLINDSIISLNALIDELRKNC